jgi:phospholipid/cholesterol/gamma-HCH transport system permease protein
MRPVRRFLVFVGRRARLALMHVGRFARLLRATAAAALGLRKGNLRMAAKTASAQVRFTGLHAAPLVAVMAAAIGAVGILEFVRLLTGLADELIGSLLVTIVVREMGPLIAAVVVIARSGTAMAAEVGTMRLGGEFDALQAYRVDPASYVLLPRAAGTVAALFALIVLFDAAGLVGGAVIASGLRGLSTAMVAAKVTAALNGADFALSAAKALLFGTAISSLSCYNGLLVRRSPTELPQAVTRGVVASLGAVFVLDAALATLFLL